MLRDTPFKFCEAECLPPILFFQQPGIFERDFDVNAFEVTVPEWEYVPFLAQVSV